MGLFGGVWGSRVFVVFYLFVCSRTWDSVRILGCAGWRRVSILRFYFCRGGIWILRILFCGGEKGREFVRFEFYVGAFSTLGFRFFVFRWFFRVFSRFVFVVSSVFFIFDVIGFFYSLRVRIESRS